MTRSELVVELARRRGLSRRIAARVVEETLAGVVDVFGSNRLTAPDSLTVLTQ